MSDQILSENNYLDPDVEYFKTQLKTWFSMAVSLEPLTQEQRQDFVLLDQKLEECMRKVSTEKRIAMWTELANIGEEQNKMLKETGQCSHEICLQTLLEAPRENQEYDNCVKKSENYHTINLSGRNDYTESVKKLGNGHTLNLSGRHYSVDGNML
jgi:hypothetical protein